MGCSPSLSGALRVNPWSVISIADGIYRAIKMNKADQMKRHATHWAYVESHTVLHWARSYTQYLVDATEGHQKMQAFGLGLGLDTFRMVALDPSFRQLQLPTLKPASVKSRKRLILCDYDGTLIPTNQVRPFYHCGDSKPVFDPGQAEPRVQAERWCLPLACIAEGPAQAQLRVQVDMSPSSEVKQLLRELSKTHTFYIVSGRVQSEMAPWFTDVPEIGIASEHGYYRKAPGEAQFVVQYPGLDFSWKEIVRPIMQMYADSTDGSYVQEKDCGLTWAFAAADPDFGRWQVCLCSCHAATCIRRQCGVKHNDVCTLFPTNASSCVFLETEAHWRVQAKELIDHLESVMLGQAIEFVAGHQYVEVKPKGLSKGATVKKLLQDVQPDFVLCLGDDKSDEEMFSAILETERAGLAVFACTVGQKPSQARFYVNDDKAVISLLSQLGEAAAAADAEIGRAASVVAS